MLTEPKNVPFGCNSSSKELVLIINARLVARVHVSSLCGLFPEGKRRYAVTPRFTRLRLCIGTTRCETYTLATGARDDSDRVGRACYNCRDFSSL